MQPHSTKITVRYSETDRMGVVHHSNYLRYLEVARTQLMKDAGYPYSQAERDGILIPVVSAQLNYISPCTYDDELIVSTRIASFKGARLTMEYEIHCGDRLILTATTSHAMTNASLRPINLKRANPHLYRLFSGEDEA